MRFHPTITLYVAKEVAVYTALGFLAAAPVVLIPNLFDRADDFLLVGITARDQFDIALRVVPLIVAYALPIAFLFGVLMAIGRLSGDLEIAALRSCGFGPAAMLVPVFGLGVLVSTMTAYLMIEVEPRAKRDLVALSLRIAARGGMIEEGRFQPFGRRMIYVQNRAPDRRLEGVMIADWSEKNRAFHVFAESGRFDYDMKTGNLRLSLENGDLRMDPDPTDAFDEYRISFSKFDYTFPALKLGQGRLRYRMDELSLSELFEAVERIESGNYERDLKYRNALMYSTQIHRMMSIPMASALFAFVGVPLGLHGAVRSRAWGMLTALALLAGYYGLFVVMQEWSRTGDVLPQIAIWVPNALLVLSGSILLYSARKIR